MSLEKKEFRTDNMAVYKYLKDLQKARGLDLLSVAPTCRIV